MDISLFILAIAVLTIMVYVWAIWVTVELLRYSKNCDDQAYNRGRMDGLKKHLPAEDSVAYLRGYFDESLPGWRGENV